MCAYCGDTIPTDKRADSRFCSTRCRRAHYAARRKTPDAYALDLARTIRDHGTEEEQEAFLILASRFPGFERRNGRALKRAVLSRADRADD